MLKNFISAWLITRIYFIYFRCGCSGIPLGSWRLDFSVMVLINPQVVFLVLGFSSLIVSYHLHLPPISIDGYKTSFPTLGWLPPRTATLEICMLLFQLSWHPGAIPYPCLPPVCRCDPVPAATKTTFWIINIKRGLDHSNSGPQTLPSEARVSPVSAFYW